MKREYRFLLVVCTFQYGGQCVYCGCQHGIKDPCPPLSLPKHALHTWKVCACAKKTVRRLKWERGLGAEPQWTTGVLPGVPVVLLFLAPALLSSVIPHCGPSPLQQPKPQLQSQPPPELMTEIDWIFCCRKINPFNYCFDLPLFVTGWVL